MAVNISDEELGMTITARQLYRWRSSLSRPLEVLMQECPLGRPSGNINDRDKDIGLTITSDQLLRWRTSLSRPLEVLIEDVRQKKMLSVVKENKPSKTKKTCVSL